MGGRRLIWPALCALLLAAAPQAGAYVVQERSGLSSAANAIALGPDGNIWAGESTTGTVRRMTPGGEVIGGVAVGGEATGLAVGPGGRLWAAVPSAKKLVWIDAASPSPTAHDVPIPGAVSDCGPAAVVAGGDGKVYFSLPNSGSCASASKLGYVSDDGTGPVTGVADRGTAFDLEVNAGKLFATNFDSNVIRRMALDPGLTVESTVTVTGGNPHGITSDSAGRIWVTLFTTGRVAYFPGSQANGAAVELSPPAGVTLSNPFGIVAGPDGRIYVTGRGSANLLRIDSANQFVEYPLAGSQPWQIVNGPDADLWMTDFSQGRLLRFVNGAPRATTGEPSTDESDSATLRGAVDPRGNATEVVFEYGTTTAYGSSTAPIAVASGVGETQVQAEVTGLAPATTYHVRVKATNPEGTTFGADREFTTPATSLPDGGPGGDDDPADTTPPVVSDFRVVPRRFAVGEAPTPVVAVARGTRFSWRQTEAGTATIALFRRAPGLRVKGRCVAPTRARRNRLRAQLTREYRELPARTRRRRVAAGLRRARCTRTLRAGALSRTATAGANSFRFTGRVGKKRLRIGRYFARLTTRDAAGNVSVPARAKFRVVPGPRRRG